MTNEERHAAAASKLRYRNRFIEKAYRSVGVHTAKLVFPTMEDTKTHGAPNQLSISYALAYPDYLQRMGSTIVCRIHPSEF